MSITKIRKKSYVLLDDKTNQKHSTIFLRYVYQKEVDWAKLLNTLESGIKVAP